MEDGTDAGKAAGGRLVSVVIPAHNAAATLEETLQSVRAQTHANLEILVVNDGSTDATAAIAERHGREDRRLRLISQPNSGVAAARNRGIGEARSDLVAVIDADDLWTRDKISRQLAAYDAAGPGTGLVYNWFAMIDPASRVIGMVDTGTASGTVFVDLLRRNFIGNGSTPLMRKDAVLACGGYDSGLRAQQAEGCEDLKLYLAIAERYRFAVVPDYLTGYRVSPGNMSSNATRMLRSLELVMQPIASTYPQHGGIIDAATAFTMFWLSRNRWRAGDRRQAMAIALAGMRRSPLAAAHFFLLRVPVQKLINLRRRAGRLIDRQSNRGADDARGAQILSHGNRFPIGSLPTGGSETTAGPREAAP